MRLSLFGHPLHAALAHFPVALLSTSIVWDLVGLGRGESLWWTIGFWNTALGLGIGLVAVYAGFMDFMVIVKQSAAFARARWHMIVMLVALAIFGCSILLLPGPIEQNDPRAWLVLTLHAGGTMAIGMGGLLGAQLVFKFGIGSAVVQKQDRD